MRVFSFHGYYGPLEGADSFDSVKQCIIENYKGNFRADEWNLAEIRCNRVKMQPGLIDMSQFNMCDAKCDDSEGDDGDGGIAGKRITGKFTFVVGELYTTADCYRYHARPGKFEICTSKSFPLAWDHFAAGVDV